MNRRFIATCLLYSFGLDTAAFAGVRPEAPNRATRAAAPIGKSARSAPPQGPKAVAPQAAAGAGAFKRPSVAPFRPLLEMLSPDGGGGESGSCDLDGQGAPVVASVSQSTSVNFNVDPPACSGDPDLCNAFSYDKSGATPDLWKAIFDLGGKKLRIETGATVSVVNVPATTNNQKAPGLEIRSSCGLDVQAGASVAVGSLNQPAGDIFIKVDGDVQIDGTVRNSVSGTLGMPGKITIASCFGDLTTGPQSRIETLGVDPGGKDINLLTCPDGGDVAINGLVRALHKYGVTPSVNVVSFGGSVTIDGRNDFGEEVEFGTTIRRTSGVVVSTTHATAAGDLRVQAKNDVTVLGNRILNQNRVQYGALAVKPHSTNGQGGDGDLIVKSLLGSIVASDRAFDFQNRFNAQNAITLEAQNGIALSVTAAVNDGAADNTKAVVSSQGGSAGQGGSNSLRSFSGQITIGQKAQVLANYTGSPGSNGTNALIACGGVSNSGTVTPADANTSNDSGTCSPEAPAPLFTSCADFGVFPPSGPQNQPPSAFAGGDLNVTLPAAAILDATVSDDGLPSSGSLTVTWAKLSGPGTVTFANAVAVDTTATFSAAGSYVLRLSASDGDLSASDDVNVSVTAANQAPNVDAGADQAITLPTNVVTLAGSVSDDGLPSGSSLAILWSLLSGPAAVGFGTPNAASTTATFSATGVYELRLSASDGDLSASDTVAVTVSPALLPTLEIASASVAEGNGSVTTGTLTVTLSAPSAVPVTVQYQTSDATATACDYATRFGTLTFAPGVVTQPIEVAVFGDLLPEAAETVIVEIGNPSGATLGQASAVLTIANDDVANQAPARPSNLLPANGASDVVFTPTLSWSTSDPDAGDSVLSDVYFGTTFGTTGQAWSRQCPATAGPSLRSRAATAYDEARDRMIVVGGLSAGGANLGDVWVLENATGAGGSPAWTALSPNGTAPSARHGASAVYDAASNRLILHGGCDGDCTNPFSDTWALQNANGTGGTPEWTALPSAPLGRSAHLGAWDGIRGAMIVFGGWNGVAERDDVWLLRDAFGAAPVWEERATGLRPSARQQAAGAYDAASDSLILHGGRFSPDTPLEDSWVLRDAVAGSPQWLETTPSEGPAARYGHVAGYDSASKRLVIFGGTNAGALSNLNFVMSDAWLLTNADGTQPSEWIRVEASDAPTGRFSASGAYSPSLNRLAVALGANNKPGAPPLDDLHSLDAAIGSLPLVSPNQAASSFQPGTLTAGTTYFWKVRANDTHGAFDASPASRFVANHPLVSVSAASLAEGNAGTSNLTFTLTLSRSSDTEARVDYATLAGSASEGDDYAAASGVLVFAPNQTTASVSVALQGDTVFEADETFTLVFSNPQGLVLASTSVVGTIANDDQAPINEAPTVDAGPDQTTILPSSVVTLAGTATDDGLPEPATLTLTWTVDSGPGIVTFGNAASASTTATFLVGGTYTLRLTADDGGLTTFDTVVISVLGPNQAPQVHAGTDIVINVPQTTALLAGSVTDDGLPLGNAVTLAWSLVSGPGTVTFGDPSALSTAATFSALGDYTLRLTANDGALQGQDDVVVTVAPQPDLTVSSIDTEFLLVDGQTLAVSGSVAVSVTNLGPGATQAFFSVSVFEDRNGNATYEAGVDNLLGGALQSGAGNGETVSVPVNLAGSLLFDDNLLHAFVDSGSQVPEVDESNNYGLSSPLPICELQQPTTPFAPTLKWSWTPATQPLSNHVMVQPAVADLNGDGVPDVAFVSFAGGLGYGAGPLRAVDGVTGANVLTSNDPLLTANQLFSAPVAVGDIDGDGRPEIVGVQAPVSQVSTTWTLVAFEHDGMFKWRSQAVEAPGLFVGGPTIADLDGDGIPEILFGRQALNNNGTLRWTGAGSRGILTGTWAAGPFSIVVDLDMDGTPEVLAGGTAYRANGTIWWSKTPALDGFASVANFDADPFPEIVLLASPGLVLYMLEHDGTIKWGPVSTAPPGFSGGVGSLVTIADLDGDGVPEIVTAGSQEIASRDSLGRVLWRKPVFDGSGIGTQAAVFDFEGDGFTEVVHSDADTLRIFRGTDGTILFQTPMASCTSTEGPTIADVDGDGHADIVAVQSSCGTSVSTGLKVYSNSTWAGTRKIWNQATYHITNVNDDATIPAHEQPSWQVQNTYRVNRLPACGDALPDLTASLLRIASQATTRTLTARIGNGGVKYVPPPVHVSFYDGNPKFGGVYLGSTVTTAALAPGGFEDVTLTLPLSTTTKASVFVAADDWAGLPGGVKESDETNNVLDSGLALTGTAGLPDLTALRVETLGIAANWQTLEVGGTVLADVRNQGDATSGVFDVLFFEDRNGNGTYEAGADNLLGSGSSNGLGSGESAMVSATVSGTLLFRDSPIHAFADSGLAVSEANESNNLARSEELCAAQPAAPFAPALEWAWNTPTYEPEFTEVAVPPAVADMNGDGFPDVVVVSSRVNQFRGILRGVNGPDGTTLFSNQDLDPAHFLRNAGAGIAVGNIDSDASPEIIGIHYSENRVLAFASDGAFKWRSGLLTLGNYPQPSIANIDGVGPPEIVVGNVVLNAIDGSTRWSGTGGAGMHSNGGVASVVADINLDGVPELIAGNTAYRFDIPTNTMSILWRNTTLPDGYVAVGNLDNDPNPEIVLASFNNIWALDHQLNVQWGPVISQGNNGPPVVADLDGDGRMEIAVVASTQINVFEFDGRLRWTAPIVSDTGFPGISAADLDGDGAAELLQTDRNNFRIYRGKDGVVLFQTAVGSSFSPMLYPVVADVDGDGNAEVVVPAAGFFNPNKGLRVFREPLDRWAGARTVWNQHSYHVTNVNDDASIPAVEKPSWIGPTGYRNSALTKGFASAAPDVTASYLRTAVAGANVTLTARVGNAGLAPAPKGLQLAFYNGNPASGGVLLGTAVTTLQLKPGEYQDLSISVAGTTAAQGSLFVVVDQPGSASECNEGNNTHDSGLYLNRAPEVSAGPDRIVSFPTPMAALSGTVSDDGLPPGASVTSQWTTISGPGTVSFGSASAPATTATFSATGDYVLRLSASDTALSAIDDVTVTVTPPNAAPTVDAGADVIIGLPQTGVALSGTASDDGLPAGSTLTTTWSGPAGVTFGTPLSLATTASFPGAGTYVLTLTADDGAVSTSDSLTVIVDPLNQAPQVSAGSGGSFYGFSTTLAGSVSDDGLPRGNTLTKTWGVTSGPGTVTFGDPSSPATTASFSTPGTYVLRLTASDGQYQAFAEVTLQPLGNAPPQTSAGADQAISFPTNSVALTGTANDDGLPVGSSVSVQWSLLSGPVAVAFSSPASLTTTASFDAAGTYVLRLTATDGQYSATDDVTVQVSLGAPVGDPPVVSLTSPADGSGVTQGTDIAGEVVSGSLLQWKLQAQRTGDSEASTIATGTTPVNGVLASFDPTLLLNGQYELILRATDTAGRTAATAITVVVKENLKVGNFTVSFTDLEVPVAGMPIRVTRTYDSRDKQSSDFGYGWRVDVSDARLQENGTAGLMWTGTKSPGFLQTYCLQPTRPAIVTITTPDGRVQEFEPQLTPECQTGGPINIATYGFRPRPGTTTLGTLEVVGDNRVLPTGSWPGPMQLFGETDFQIFDPDTYRLTLLDGRQFIVNQVQGLTQIKDLNGNTLVVNSSGITHSSGKGVAFSRDGFGRITRVTDPDGNHLDYGYSIAGDLVSVKDREEKESTYTYLAVQPHLLDEIRDPLGRAPLKNEYDASGRLVAHTDAFGKRIEYTHDIGTRQEVIKDRNDKIRVVEYDARGNVVKVAQPDGKQIVRTFDARNNRLSETEPHEPSNPTPPTTTWIYDAQDAISSVTDGGNNTAEFTYNARKQVLTTKDPRGRFTVNSYDVKGNLLSTKSGGISLGGPFFSETSNTYDAAGNQLTQTVIVGGVAHTTSNTYNSFGYLTKVADANNHETAFTYDGKGNRLTQTTTRTLPGGGTEPLVKSLEYDKNGRLKKAIDLDSSSTRTVYDEMGRQKETYDKLDHKTSVEYDANGQLVKVTFPDNTTEENGYDNDGRRTSRKDRRGKVTSFEYDDIGRLTKTTHPDLSFTTNSYDAAGRLIAATNERGKTTQYQYDAAGRRTKVIDANNKETVFTYDQNSNQKTVKDPLGRVTTFEYDDLNRRTKTIFPDTSFTETAYDELSRRTSEKDQLGRITSFSYDKLSRLVKVTDARLKDMVYAHDEVGNRVSQTDANNRITRFEYDKLGRETKRCLPDNKCETKTYDAVGNVKTRTDFMDRVTTYDYDQNNRLTSRTYPTAAEDVSFTYTASGRRETATDALGVTSYLYDDRDRPTRKTVPDGRRLEYGWDAASNRTALTAVLAGGAQTPATSYTWDNLNRLGTVTDPQNRVAIFTYDDNSNRETASYPNGVVTGWGYDTLNRLTSISTTRPASGTTIQGHTLMLGPNGRREQVTEHDGTARGYGYDALDRLTRETVTETIGQLFEKVWTYDDVGNRLTQTTTGQGAGIVTYNYDDRDRILLENATGYSYDDNGNLVTKSGDQTLTWNHENRLVRVTKTDSTVVEHIYDVDGNRVRTTTTLVGGSPQATDYLVDTTAGLSHVVTETDGAGVLQAYYVRGTDDLISVVRPGGSRWVHADHLGSTRRLTDENGLITDGYTFDAWGVLIGHTGTDPLAYRFAGEPFDSTTGLADHRARWMDPRLGRFANVDPFGGDTEEPLSLHRYLYAAADPVGKSDPTGLFTLATIGTAMAMSNTIQATPAPNRQAMTQQIALVPLPASEESRMRQALSNLMNLTPSQKCQKNCIDPLVNTLQFSFSDFKTFLKGGAHFYDGTKTQAPISGNLYPAVAAKSFLTTNNLAQNAGIDALFNRQGTTQINAHTSFTTPALTIYFRPSAITKNSKDNGALLFHEALHGYGTSLGGTSYNDQDLQGAFFGQVTQTTGNITQHLRKNCF